MDNHTIPKDDIVEKLQEKYNPQSVGEIMKHPPHGDYHVSLYFDNSPMTMPQRYNVRIKKDTLCHFEIANFSVTNSEILVSVKLTVEQYDN
jgi:hypothetical protein